MKLKAIDATRIASAMQAVGNIGLPINETIKFNKNRKALTEAAQVVDERRMEIGKKHGTVNEAEGRFDFPDDDAFNAFNEEVTAMYEEEIDIDIHPISMTRIPSDTIIAPNALDALAGVLFKEQGDDDG